MRFVDTNVLLYAISDDPAEVQKRDRALMLLAASDLALSVQVLQEFYTQATRASRTGRLQHAEATALITAWQRFPVQETTVALVERAMATSQRFQISYWDAAIIEGARAAGCDVVLSEDLQHQQRFDGVRVENPFL
jgi:predicted nucleic acid-binding protein